MVERIGNYTMKLAGAPSVLSFAAVASKKESEGPMASYIDIINQDSMFGQTTWEKAESSMQQEAANKALTKAQLSPGQIDVLFAGDLLNQCIGSHYGLRDLGIPFVGIYGACSNMAESLGLAALFVESAIAGNAMAVTSSHFCSAERQFRFPLEYGGVRTPTAQWTVTGAGGAIVGASSMPPYVKQVSFGSILDKGIKDINNMGAAMAPAAAQTLTHFFQDTLTCADNYDLILTGDLGSVGSELLYELMERDSYNIRKKHADCGLMIYDRDRQDVQAGGSGCGCSATVLCSYILQSMREGKIRELLFMATGALMSTVSVQQGESIPAIAHLVHLSNRPDFN